MNIPPRSQFPLLELPFPMRRAVFKRMTTLEKICYALMCDEAKDIVKSLIRPTEKIIIKIGDGLLIKAKHIHDLPDIILKFGDDEEERNIDLSIPTSVKSTHQLENPKPHSLNHPEFTTRQWIQFFMEILSASKIELRFYGDCSHLNFNSILETLQGFNIYELILHEAIGVHGPRILESFQSTKRLYMIEVPTMERENFMRVIQREYDFLAFNRTRFDITHEDLLSMNSKKIELAFTVISPQELNEFLKGWMNERDSRLELFGCRMIAGSSHESILDGIDHEVVPAEEERNFGFENDIFTHYIDQKTNYDIKRNDGVKATVCIHTYSRSMGFRFMVHH